MLRLMFVGDSMTVGSAGDITWRYRMWQHLRGTVGGPFRFVGSRTALYDRATDAATSHDYGAPDFPASARRHFAGWGEGWYHMAPAIGAEVARHRPDVLLVSLGLIDLGFYTLPGQTAQNVRATLLAARAANPSVHAVLLPVVPNIRAGFDAQFAEQCAELNALTAEAVAELDTPDSPLLLTGPPAGWDPRLDTYDGTHPNASGEHRIAGAFADAVHRAWGIGGPYRHPRDSS